MSGDFIIIDDPDRERDPLSTEERAVLLKWWEKFKSDARLNDNEYIKIRTVEIEADTFPDNPIIREDK